MFTHLLTIQFFLVSLLIINLIIKLTRKRVCGSLFCLTAMPWWWGLTRPEQLSMATARAIWLCACVRYWPNRGLVFECVTCFYCCFWIVGGIGISREKKAGMGVINKIIWAGNQDLSTFCEPSKILIGAWINTKNSFSWELENINFIVQRKLRKHMKNLILSLILRLLLSVLSKLQNLLQNCLAVSCVLRSYMILYLKRAWNRVEILNR